MEKGGGMRFVRVLCIWAAALCGTAGTLTGAVSQTVALSEYEIKAGYLYNFAKFTAWPESPGNQEKGAFTIGILGKNPFGEALALIEGQQIRGLPIEIVPVRAPSQAKNCHMLFIGGAARDDLAAVIAAVEDLPVLTVGETVGYETAGVIITLVRSGNRIRFRINPVAAQSAGLHISAHLLRLATIVGTSVPSGETE